MPDVFHDKNYIKSFIDSFKFLIYDIYNFFLNLCLYISLQEKAEIIELKEGVSLHSSTLLLCAL